jgi:hypothetical protein
MIGLRNSHDCGDNSLTTIGSLPGLDCDVPIRKRELWVLIRPDLTKVPRGEQQRFAQAGPL